jgi:hypothetical protein
MVCVALVHPPVVSATRVSHTVGPARQQRNHTFKGGMREIRKNIRGVRDIYWQIPYTIDCHPIKISGDQDPRYLLCKKFSPLAYSSAYFSGVWSVGVLNPLPALNFPFGKVLW